MSLAAFVPSLPLFLGSGIAVALAAVVTSLATFVMVLFSASPQEPQGGSQKGSSNGLGGGDKNPNRGPGTLIVASVILSAKGQSDRDLLESL